VTGGATARRTPYSITVANAGQSDAQAVSLSDTWPALTQGTSRPRKARVRARRISQNTARSGTIRAGGNATGDGDLLGGRQRGPPATAPTRRP
jgi:hypothetical protein